MICSYSKILSQGRLVDTKKHNTQQDQAVALGTTIIFWKSSSKTELLWLMHCGHKHDFMRYHEISRYTTCLTKNINDNMPISTNGRILKLELEIIEMSNDEEVAQLIGLWKCTSFSMRNIYKSLDLNNGQELLKSDVLICFNMC